MTMKGNSHQVNYKPSESLKQLQEIDTVMLKEITSLLEKHNIRYYLIAGTLLGAVRHQNFIPWDDDLDLGLPRPDYERFLKHKDEWLRNQYKAENYQSNPEYKYYITRVYNQRVKVKELRGSGEHAVTNASMDLFPLDGTPNNKFMRKIFLKKIMFYRMLSSLANYNNIDQHRKRSNIEKLFISTMGLFHTEKWLNKNKIYDKIDHLLKNQNFETSQYVGAVMGAYREKEIFEKTFIESRSRYTFADFTAYGPKNYDGYLRHMYGNYMQVPTIDQIEEKKHFEILMESES